MHIHIPIHTYIHINAITCHERVTHKLQDNIDQPDELRTIKLGTSGDVAIPTSRSSGRGKTTRQASTRNCRTNVGAPVQTMAGCWVETYYT